MHRSKAYGMNFLMSTQQFNFWSSKRQRKRSAESYRIGFRNAKLNRKEQNVDSYRPTPHIFVTLKRRRYRRQRQRSVHKVGVYDEWPKGNGLNGGVVKYSRYCPGNDVDRLRKTTRSHDSLIPTVIRNRHIRNTSLEYYGYDKLFDVLISLS